MLFHSEITPDLAEFCGIHAGDGYLRKRANGATELDISGGINEKDYYDAHVVPLFKRVFGFEVCQRFFPYRNTYGFVTHNREVAEFMHSLGFPYGKKTLTVAVPENILQSRDLDIIYGFLRGLFDTDGTITFSKRAGSGYKKFHLKRHTYPIISLTVCSKPLWEGTCSLLARTGFSFVASYTKSVAPEHDKYNVALRGDQSLVSWIQNIGFKNKIKFNRFLIWKMFGFMPPKLTFSDQMSILQEKTSPEDYYQEKMAPNENIAPFLVKKRLAKLETFGEFLVPKVKN